MGASSYASGYNEYLNRYPQDKGKTTLNQYANYARKNGGSYWLPIYHGQNIDKFQEDFHNNAAAEPQQETETTTRQAPTTLGGGAEAYSEKARFKENLRKRKG